MDCDSKSVMYKNALKPNPGISPFFWWFGKAQIAKHKIKENSIMTSII